MSGTTTPQQAQLAAAQKAQQQNGQARLLVLQNASRNVLKLGSFGTYAPGGNLNVQLTNIGLLTGIRLHVKATFNITTLTVPSVLAPFNLLSNIQVKDYQSTSFVNIDGHSLFVLNSIRHRNLEGYGRSYSIAPEFTQPAAAIPAVPTAVANNVVMEFFLYIPIAYSPESDLTGSMVMQSVTGQMFVNITFNNSFVGADSDSVYTAGVTTAPAISVDIYQEYLGLVSIGGSTIPIPMIDTGTVYELNGGLVTTDNIAVNQEKLIDYPNFRTVLSLLVRYTDAGAVAFGNIAQIRQIVNANQYLKTFDEPTMRQRMLEALGFDIPGGYVYMSNRMDPVQTVLYGNVQLGITPSNAGAGNTKMTVLTESTYARGATLTGMSQGG